MSEIFETYINSPVLIVITIIFIIVLVIGFFGDKYLKQQKNKRIKENFEKKQDIQMKNDNNKDGNVEANIKETTQVNNIQPKVINESKPVVKDEIVQQQEPMENVKTTSNVQPSVPQKNNATSTAPVFNTIPANNIPGSTMNTPVKEQDNSINNLF